MSGLISMKWILVYIAQNIKRKFEPGIWFPFFPYQLLKIITTCLIINILGKTMAWQGFFHYIDWKESLVITFSLREEHFASKKTAGIEIFTADWIVFPKTIFVTWNRLPWIFCFLSISFYSDLLFFFFSF